MLTMLVMLKNVHRERVFLMPRFVLISRMTSFEISVGARADFLNAATKIFPCEKRR